MIRSFRLVVLTFIVLAYSRDASAQLVVFDPAAVIKIVEQSIVVTKQFEQLKSMATRLQGLGQFNITPIKPTDWDVAGSLAPARVNEVATAAEMIAAMPEGPAKQQRLQELAFHFASARGSSHAMKQGGLVQADAAGQLASAINALRGSIMSSSDDDQQLASILQKIAAASGIHAHQLDGQTNVQIGSLNQLAIMQQRQINLDVEGINTAVTTMELVEPIGDSYTRGTSAVIRNWRSQ